MARATARVGRFDDAQARPSRSRPEESRESRHTRHPQKSRSGEKPEGLRAKAPGAPGKGPMPESFRIRSRTRNRSRRQPRSVRTARRDETETRRNHEAHLRKTTRRRKESILGQRARKRLQPAPTAVRPRRSGNPMARELKNSDRSRSPAEALERIPRREQARCGQSTSTMRPRCQTSGQTARRTIRERSHITSASAPARSRPPTDARSRSPPPPSAARRSQTSLRRPEAPRPRRSSLRR